MTDGPARALSSEHLEALLASGLQKDVIAQRGYWTATVADLERLRFLGHSPAIVEHAPALMLPVHDVFGHVPFMVARPDVPRLDPRGRPKKYETPRGVQLTLDVPPSVRQALSDPDTRLWVTEGCKKVDAAVASGAGCALALLGVWAWKKHSLSAWDAVTLRGRTVYLAFDSDAATNPKVTQALKRLMSFLRARGAEVLVVPLEPNPDGTKVGLDDALASGASLDELAATSTTELRIVRPSDDRRPELDVGTLDLRVSETAFAHLAKAGVFRSGGRLVRVTTEDGATVVRQLPTVDLRAVLHRTVRCVRSSEARGVIPCQPPRDLAEDLAHAPDAPVPVLRAVATAPTFTGEGRLLEAPGYDARSGILITLNWTPRPIPAAPTADDMQEARAWWDAEALVDFPFASPADRTAAMALALTPPVRELIDGPTPGFGVEASVRGSGKGKLVTTALTPALGPRGWTVAALPREEDELRKALTAYLAERRAAVLFDNITHPVRSAVLAKALTDTIWDDRLLGRSESVRVPVRCTWVLTSNNPAYGDEIARRVVPVRLVPQTDRPELRRDFLHPELEPWVAVHRADLLWSLGVFVRAWQVAGCPEPTCPELGSYEAWRRVVGGILEVAGYADFLGNRETLLSAADPEMGTWAAFLAAWWVSRGPHFVSVADLMPMAEVHGVRINGDSEHARTTSLGAALASRRDRFFGLYQLQQGTGRMRRHWCLTEAVTPSDTRDTSPLEHLRVARTRTSNNPGSQVAQVSRGVTEQTEDPISQAWGTVHRKEADLEREAIAAEGAV